MNKSILTILMGVSFPTGGTSWNDAALPSYYYGIAEELQRRGHRVELLVDGRNELALASSKQIAVKLWPNARPVTPGDICFASRTIAELRPNAVLSNFGSVNALMLASWWHRVPHRLAWYHTLTTQLDQDSGVSTAKRFLLRLRKRVVYGMATTMIAVSEHAKQNLCSAFHLSPKRVAVWTNAIRDPLSGQDLTPLAARERQGIVFVGRLDASKGVDVLLRAVAQLRRSACLASLQIFGDGPLREELTRQARELGLDEATCVFHGRQFNRAILLAMANARAVAVPSLQEAFGLVAVEAMAVATPVVGSRCGGLSEIIQTGVTGLLIPPGDANALAESLRTLLTNDAVWNRQSAAARDRFVSRFDTRAAIPQLVDWLERTAGPR